MNKKVILVSGGSDGLGKAIAYRLSPNHQVVILSHNEEKLKATSAEINCDFVVADVTDYSSLEQAVRQVVEKYKNIDVLVNNAGIWMEGLLEESDPKQIEEVVKVNALGPIFLTKAVIPTMKSQGQGRVINIVSQDGLKSKRNRSVYSASKWAATGFTKCLQEDLSEKGIGVTGIYPGLMKTSLFEKQGVSRDLSHSLELSEVAAVVEFVVNLPAETLIPDIGIKNINNSSNMDDTTVSSIGLNINPDLITPQVGVPQLASPVVSAPGINLPIDKGVIDITPTEISTTTTTTTVETPGLAHLADLVPQTTPPQLSEPVVPLPSITIPDSTVEPSTSISTPVMESPVMTEPPVGEKISSHFSEDPDQVKLGGV